MATSVLMINARYQVSGKPIGQGGMGLVYKAYDVVTKRHVALKTMRGPLNSAALELFSKEWTVLARISHPNIVDILDSGELDDGGERKPFFVMPYLQGATLDELIRKSSQRLTVDRVIGIASQACRGLHAAHEQGLVHRDLKPSNIFVMEDDTVKIIDFGVVHLVGADSVTGLKGTVQYMAPEQIEMKPISPASDVFALSVVCYESLTGRKPFDRTTYAETAEAVRRHIPPPVSELNPLVTQIVSRVIHKGMAKEPWHRFSTAREYADTLQKALHNQPIERFDRGKIQPRIERAKRAQAEGDLQFGSEILTELEAEGNIDPEMTVLRIQIDHAIRQKSVRQLLETARTRLEEDEFPLALQKIQEVLEIDPDNADALGLRTTIQKQRSEHQIENWFRLVEQHIHNRAFPQARLALEEILKISPGHAKARDLLVDVGRREEEIRRLWAEKEQLYQAALSAYQHGEVSSALTKLERVLDLNRQSPDSALPDRDAQYQNLYNQIRTEREAARNSYAEGRRHMVDRNFAKALEICTGYLNKFPADPMFQALQLEIEEQQRQEQSSFIADVARRAEAEPDLDRRVNILKEAAERYPDEPHFQQSLRLIRERRDLVNSIVAKARQYEERGQFSEALGQWDILRNIYAQYPGIDFEVERLRRRRNDQVREENKARWVEQIDRHISAGDYTRARDLANSGLAEFPEDKELAGLGRLAQQSLDSSAEADVWLQRGQQLCFDRQFGEGLEALRKASSLDNRNPVIRAALLNALVEQARSVLGQDWRAAEPLIQQALSIDGGHPLAKSLQGLVLDYKHQEIVNECISQARELQAAGDLAGALTKVEQGLTDHPNEVRLAQLRSTLRGLAGEPSVPPTAVAPGPGSTISVPVATASLSPAARGDAPTSGSDADDSVVTIRQPAAPPRSLPSSAPPSSGAASVAARAAVQFNRLLAWLQAAGVPRGHFSPLQWLVFAVVPVVLLSAFVVTGLRRQKPPPTAAITLYAVNLEGDVPGARITAIDGKAAGPFPVTLAAGKHTAEALLPGYKSGPQDFVVLAGVAGSQTVKLHLEPEPVRIQLSSDLKTGQVSLDGGPRQDLRDIGFAQDVSPGANHTLALFAGNKELLSISFRANPGEAPALTSPVKVQDLDALVISTLSGRARVYSSNASLKGALKDRALQPIPLTGLELDTVPAKPELVVEDSKGLRPPLPFEAGNAPVLSIMINDPGTAALYVEFNPPDVEVSVDGKPRRPRNGKLWLPLEPGQHALHVARDGYAPEDRTIEMKKGQPRVLPRIDLKQLVRPASLVIDGATPDAEIWIDGRLSARTSAEGHYETEGIAEGSHSILLKKQYYEDKPLGTKTFTGGQTVRIAGTEAQLIPWGSIEFSIPEDYELTWRAADGSTRGEGTKPVRVKAGHYYLTVSAAGKTGTNDGIDVEPGKVKPFSWKPPIVETKRDPTPPPPPVSMFERPEDWKKNGQLWVHSGGDMGWMRSNQGQFTITIPRPKAGLFGIKKSHIEWIVDQKDEKNRIEYSVDSGGNLERRVYVNGARRQSGGIKLKGANSFTVRIDISKDRVAISDEGNKRDEYQRPKPGEGLGRFGFKGDVAIQIVQER